MHRGYVRLYRKMLDGGILEDAVTLQVWIWLLLNATHKPRKLIYKGESYSLEPGQVFMSLRHVSDFVKVPRETVKRRIGVLKVGQRITTQTVHRGTIVSICNWEQYQPIDTESGTQNGTQDGTANGTQAGHKRDKNKNDKKEEAPESLPWGEQFAAAWGGWIADLKERRVKVSAGGYEQQLKKLAASASEQDAIAMINVSIEKGYRSVFPLKADFKPKPTPPKYEEAD